jgi:fructose-specific phosphotransferase system IIC component
MIEGISLGIISWISIMFSWWHLPERLKKITFKVPVLSDITVGLLTYMFISSLSKSLVALIATIVTTLMWNITIVIGRHIKMDKT